MIFAALTEAANRGELLLIDSGLCRWHRRRDSTVTIREIMVLPLAQRRGLGRKMVELVQAQNPASPLTARCPVALSSNGFWQHMGFVLVGEKGGVNTWRRQP